MKKTIGVYIEDLEKEITVKKLPLGRFAELIEQLDQGIFDLIKDFDGMDEDKIFEDLPRIVRTFFPEFIKLIPLAVNKQLSEEEVRENVDLEEAIDICKAAWEVNNLSKLMAKGKKMKPRTAAGQKKASGTQTG